MHDDQEARRAREKLQESFSEVAAWKGRLTETECIQSRTRLVSSTPEDARWLVPCLLDQALREIQGDQYDEGSIIDLIRQFDVVGYESEHDVEDLSGANRVSAQDPFWQSAEEELSRAKQLLFSRITAREAVGILSALIVLCNHLPVLGDEKESAFIQKYWSNRSR